MSQQHILSALEIEVAFLHYLVQQMELATTGSSFEIVESSARMLGVQNIQGYLEKLQSLGVISDFSPNGLDEDADEVFEVEAKSTNLKKYLHVKEVELSHHKPPQAESEKKILWIEYDEINREILLNGVLLLVIPQYGKTSYEIFSYIFKRPNQPIDVQAMFKELDVEYRDPSKILADLKFSSDLKRLFFNNTSQRKLEFNNPLSKQHIDKLFPNRKPRLF